MNISWSWLEDIIEKIKKLFKSDSNDDNSGNNSDNSNNNETGTLNPSKISWNGPNYSKAITVLSFTSVSMSGTHLNFKTNKPIPWPKSGSKNVNAIGFLIRKIGNNYIGGKTEWCVGDRGWYDIVTNTKDGYNGHTMPKKGEKCWAGLGHPNNTNECSTIVEFTWTYG